MSAITTHVLDTARGRPAAGLPVTLEARDAELRAAADEQWNITELRLRKFFDAA